MNALDRWKQYPQQVFIAFDQLVNALVPPLWTLSYADETLSARTWRAAKRGKRIGRVALPIIDFLFAWQATDPALVDESGQPAKGHCHRAYLKEKARRGLPPEYRESSQGVANV
jgi:hypothetical protein